MWSDVAKWSFGISYKVNGSSSTLERTKPITEIPSLIMPVERPGSLLIKKLNFFINSFKTEMFCLLWEREFHTQLGVLKSPAIKTLPSIIASHVTSSNALLVRYIPPSHLHSLPTRFLYILTTRVFLQCLFNFGSSSQISMRIKYGWWIRSVI